MIKLDKLLKLTCFSSLQKSDIKGNMSLSLIFSPSKSTHSERFKDQLSNDPMDFMKYSKVLIEHAFNSIITTLSW